MMHAPVRHVRTIYCKIERGTETELRVRKGEGREEDKVQEQFLQALCQQKKDMET
jgi:hypothetical protein